MGYFSSDSAGTIDGSVDPVYVSLGQGGSMAAIYPTHAVGLIHCKFIGSPSEKGTIIFDNKIFMPLKCTVQGLVKPEHFHIIQSANDEIYLRKVVKGKVFMKAGYFPNMMLESVEIIDDKSRYDATEVKLTLVEFMEADMKPGD